MVSPFAEDDPSLAVWVFRIVMPLSLAGAFLARKRTGWPLFTALLLAALLGASARRAISIYGCIALVAAPLLVDAALARIKPRSVRPATGLLAAALLAGVAGIGGLLNGRIFLAQDKNFHVGSFGPPNYNVRPAAIFLRDQHVEGPILHPPVHAGPLLLENGDRLTPFLDARWLGTPETIDLFLRLRQADDRTIPALWTEVCASRQFQAVLLDFYEMPALLRRLWVDPDWAPVFIDDGGAVFVARRGPNRQLARSLERSVRAAVLDAPADVQERLAEATRAFLQSPRPPVWKGLEFPWASFYRANFGLQVREPRVAQAAYLKLLENENGSLWASTHRLDILGNLLWCLPPEETDAGIELLGALRAEPSLSAENRRSLLLQELRARVIRNDPKAEALAEEISRDREMTPQERQWAWAQIATGREQQEDWEGLLAALERAEQELTGTPQIWRSMGLVLDLRLQRTEEAAQAYRRFLELGGADSLVSQRLRMIESSSSPSR
jgi:tetratricopeptide (TPR) repeat protein